MYFYTSDEVMLFLHFFAFFLSFSLLNSCQLSIRNFCKPFFSLLYNCQLLCFWRLNLITVVEVFPLPFFQILLLQGCLPQTRYAQLYAVSMSGVYFVKFLKVIFLLSPFEKLHRSLFYLSILFLTFLSSYIFQMHLGPFPHCFLGSIFLTHKQQYSKQNSVQEKNFLCLMDLILIH